MDSSAFGYEKTEMEKYQSFILVNSGANFKKCKFIPVHCFVKWKIVTFLTPPKKKICQENWQKKTLSDEERQKTQKARKQLFLASGFCILFMIAEVVGGFLANSLALLSDATHLLSDCAGLFISITALVKHWLVQREAGGRFSFGYHRAEIIGALFSIMLIWGLTVWLVIEAIRRLITKPAVDGKIMFIVACLGILVNIIMGFSFFFFFFFLERLKKI
ncbi:CDF transporter, membrane protein [Reticulomyxa filosa]|uniref:CDF transporter, membrane protein n=1 Tax=Reticulomyxa filosa TaxID=46433 RepID=X6NQT3_RETFI|nr:CDF transporter, membrane protein [Reticulomyxa filosa]|eukprot:ETO28064.1 CDF transporter, membrane protein [Reticulomyxa filosa]